VNEKVQNEKKELTLEDIISIINQRFNSLEQRFEQRFNSLEQRLDSLESEIKIVKLTQKYMSETGGISIQKPLESVSLVSFLTEKEKVNSFFKFNR